MHQDKTTPPPSEEKESVPCILDDPIQPVGEVHLGGCAAGQDVPSVGADAGEPKALRRMCQPSPQQSIATIINQSDQSIAHSPRAPRLRSSRRSRRSCS